ncbi:MAG: hypothetical protein J5787_01775 [Alphaproteobacteria bacterium]|nr:hypothetical protein [Alphaproteobacteria bacterium]
MTRVPTTATYNLYMSQMTKQKAAMTDMSYQASTGNKYASYDKYGISTYRLLSLQNEQAVTTKYLETNSITQVVLETQQTSMDGIRSSLMDIRSRVREFYSNDLISMSKNPSEEELISLRNVQEAAFEAMSLLAYYLNTEIDGNYIFGGGKTTVPPVDFNYTTLEEFQAVYDGNILTYPDTYSAALSKMSTSAETLEGITIEQEFQTIEPKAMVYSGSATNAMAFDFTSSTLTADAHTFDGLSVGDRVLVTGTGINDQTLTINYVSADGSTLCFDEDISDETLENSAAVTLTTLPVNYRGSDSNTMTFDGTAQTLTADSGTFDGLEAGDQVTITGTASNNKTLTIANIVDDGTTVTITFEGTDVEDEAPITDSSGVTLRTVPVDYPGSATNEMTFANRTSTLTAAPGTFNGLEAGYQLIIENTTNNDGTLTVLSVSEDGSTVTFAEEITDEAIADSTDVTFTTEKWTFASEYDRLTDTTTNSLTGRVGSFSDLREGEQILLAGTTSNNGYLTIQSISRDGSTIYFEETVTDEVLDTPALTTGDVTIQQSTKTGKITANSSVGEVIETFQINRFLNVDTENNTLTSISGTFSQISGGQTITITDASGQEYTLYVKSVSPDGSTLNISTSTPVPDTNITDTPLTLCTRSDIGGFVTSSLKGSALQTGDVFFNLNQNTMTATVRGAFSQYNAGDCLIIKGADSNDQIYIVDSVSEDGRTVKFSDDTRIVTEMNNHSGTPLINGEGLTICKTYSVGATVKMNGTNSSYNGLYTVLGVSADGKELTVRTENFPEYGLTESFVSASFTTDIYYQGGNLASGYRINETTKIDNDINASSSAFEKIFRALGNIAQGNMLDAENPENAEKRVSEALDLLDKAIMVNPNKKNDDVTSIQYAVITKLDRVKTTIEDQTDLQNSLDAYISALTQVDKTEAVTMLLQASENLKVSYSVLSTMNQLTLLNYL